MEVSIKSLSAKYSLMKSPSYRSDGIITLFSTTETGQRFNNRIVGIVQKQGKSFRSIFNNSPYTRTLHILESQFTEDLTSMEYYFSKVYCAKGLEVYYRVVDYMASLGFRNETSNSKYLSSGLTFTKASNDMNQNETITIVINGVGTGEDYSDIVKVAQTKGKGDAAVSELSLQVSNSFQEIRAAIGSLLLPTTLLSMGHNMDLYNQIGDASMVSEIKEEETKFVRGGIEKTVDEYREVLIEQLESMLVNLRSSKTSSESYGDLVESHFDGVEFVDSLPSGGLGLGELSITVANLKDPK